MNKFLITFFLAVLLFGCANSQNTAEQIKNETLIYTQKFEDTNNKFLVIATYLNPVYKNKFDDKNEHFLVSIYPKESKIDYESFRLNGAKMNVDLINNDDIEEIKAFKLPWSMYIRLKSPQQNSDVLSLSFDRITDLNQTNGRLKVSLNFQKVAKSLHWNAK